MAVAVREPIPDVQRLELVADDRRPYRCDVQRGTDTPRPCNRRVADIEGDATLLVSCERCGHEHEFDLRTDQDRANRTTISTLLALVAYFSYDGDATP
jgi:uncharacterized metal-binding protein YceD (DUF177 family)